MAQRGKDRLKRSGVNEEAMVFSPWSTREDQYGEAAASQLSPICVEG
jgi:hypothetical protein